MHRYWLAPLIAFPLGDPNVYAAFASWHVTGKEHFRSIFGETSLAHGVRRVIEGKGSRLAPLLTIRCLKINSDVAHPAFIFHAIMGAGDCAYRTISAESRRPFVEPLVGRFEKGRRL